MCGEFVAALFIFLYLLLVNSADLGQFVFVIGVLDSCSVLRHGLWRRSTSFVWPCNKCRQLKTIVCKLFLVSSFMNRTLVRFGSICFIIGNSYPWFLLPQACCLDASVVDRVGYRLGHCASWGRYASWFHIVPKTMPLLFYGNWACVFGPKRFKNNKHHKLYFNTSMS